MQAVFYTDVSKIPPGAEGRLLNMLPANVQDEVARCHPGIARLLRLCGKLLMQRMLQHLGSTAMLNDIQYNEFGKPYLLYGPAFNVAHSGTKVVCAGCTESTVGIDLELVREIDTTLFDEYLTPTELELAKNSADAEDTFYKLWVRKEAIVKAIGKGVFHPLHELEVTGETIAVDGQNFYYTELDLGTGYRCCVASECGKVDVMPEEVFFT